MCLRTVLAQQVIDTLEKMLLASSYNNIQFVEITEISNLIKLN